MEPEKPVDEQQLIADYKRRLPNSIFQIVEKVESYHGALTYYELVELVASIKEDKRLRHEYLEAEREKYREALRRQKIKSPYNAGRNAALLRGNERSRKLHRSGNNREWRGEFRGGDDKRTMRVD